MADVVKQFARLVVEFGDSKVAKDEQRSLLLREWFEAFANYSPQLLHRAVSKCVATGEFWPKISAVLSALQALRQEAASEYLHATGYGRYRAADQRDPPPPTAEQKARVARMVADFKKPKTERTDA